MLVLPSVFNAYCRRRKKKKKLRWDQKQRLRYKVAIGIDGLNQKILFFELTCND